ncbi:MAG: hypothetical protein EON58_23060, partial [Alphaproteobacteria bacterium]
MKKYFVYTTLAALATVSLMPHGAFAQDEVQVATTITIDTDDTAIAAAPSAQAAEAVTAFNIARDGNYIYSLDGYDTMAGLSNVAELERQLEQINTRIKSLEDSIKSGYAGDKASFEKELVRSKANRE